LIGAVLATIVQLIAGGGPGGFGSPATLGVQLFGFVALAASYAPVVLLVLVVRTYVPRGARA